MYRAIEKTITNQAKRNPVLIIEGPPGYGKRELVRKLFPDKKIVNFEDSYIRQLAQQSPRTFLLAFPDGLIIMEAFKVKGILDAVKYYVDANGFSPAKYILTSSYKTDETVLNNEDIPYSRIFVTGLYVEELIKQKKASNNPFENIVLGQHPNIFFKDYTLDTVVENIINQAMNHPTKKINSSNEFLFRKFLESCAKISGQNLSMNQIAKEVGISAPTVKMWISILEDLCVANVVSCENKGPIFYLTNTGITCKFLGLNSPSDLILSQHRDAIVTSFVLGELSRIRLSKNLPLDLRVSIKDPSGQLVFFAKWNKKYEISICPQIEVTESFFQKKTLNKSNKKRIILHLGDVTYTNKGVDCVSWRDWYKFACEIDYFS